MSNWGRVGAYNGKNLIVLLLQSFLILNERVFPSIAPFEVIILRYGMFTMIGAGISVIWPLSWEGGAIIENTRMNIWHH